ncbi:MAG: hypothetical protein B6A08_12810 [Sorangiineae bacterium NIC37A_2]|nr:MAG: hypothetical protein B6A08_12810 [Sorangiineae bacterium NIC37A_2]
MCSTICSKGALTGIESRDTPGGREGSVGVLGDDVSGLGLSTGLSTGFSSLGLSTGLSTGFSSLGLSVFGLSSLGLSSLGLSSLGLSVAGLSVFGFSSLGLSVFGLSSLGLSVFGLSSLELSSVDPSRSSAAPPPPLGVVEPPWLWTVTLQASRELARRGTVRARSKRCSRGLDMMLFFNVEGLRAQTKDRRQTIRYFRPNQTEPSLGEDGFLSERGGRTFSIIMRSVCTLLAE